MPSLDTPLQIVPIPAFQDNYIWLLSDGVDAVVVDPGEAAPVSAALRAAKLRLRAILLTHHHRDHVGGVRELLDLHSEPGAPIEVMLPAGEAIDIQGRRLRGGEVVQIAAPACRFEVIDVPGHTRGHIAYFGDVGTVALPSPVVFCGDTLFSAGCGRLFEGTPAQMLVSLDALGRLPDPTRVCCAHEYTLSNLRFARACDPHNRALAEYQDAAQALRDAARPTLPSTIEQEKRINPFLRVDDASLLASLAAHLGHPPSSRVDAFAALRAWKDGFK